MGVWADKLLAKLDRPVQWPHDDIAKAWREVTRFAAFRDSDRDRLKLEHGLPAGSTARYMVDPLPKKASQSYASLLFGRAPLVTPADDADADTMRETLQEMQYGTGLRNAEVIVSSEGEAYWRAHVDLSVSDRPIVTWYSRTAVVPMFSAGRLVAVAFVARLDKLTEHESPVYRHFEIIDAEHVHNVLYRGNDMNLGERLTDAHDDADRDALDTRPETTGLLPVWEHELPRMPAGRVINEEGVDPTLGVSDYDGVEDLFLELNACVMTGAKNRHLTAKKRVVVSAAALDEQGKLPDDQEVIVAEAVDAALGSGAAAEGGAYKVLEYTFDALPLIQYADNTAIKALSRMGIAAQFVGVPTEDGFAPSGTSLRLRLIPTTNAGEGKAAHWLGELPAQLEIVQLLDSRPVEQNGCGHQWTDPETPPGVALGPQLPEDRVEEATRHSTLLTAGGESRRQAVREMHPEWSDDDVDEEVERIAEDRGADSGGGAGSLFGNLLNPGAGADSADDGRAARGQQDDDEADEESDETPE